MARKLQQARLQKTRAADFSGGGIFQFFRRWRYGGDLPDASNYICGAGQSSPGRRIMPPSQSQGCRRFGFLPAREQFAIRAVYRMPSFARELARSVGVVHGRISLPAE